LKASQAKLSSLGLAWLGLPGLGLMAQAESSRESFGFSVCFHCEIAKEEETQLN
jgi:hypothetical protein